MSYLKNRLALFSNPNFTCYVISCALAMFGNGLTYIVMTWVLLNYQASVSSIAIMMACFWLPNILLGPLLGVYVDRVNRRNLLLLANASRAIILLGFAWVASMSLHPWLIYLLALLTGSILSLYIPAAVALVREIVPKKDLLYANATIDIAYEVGALAGMGTAGFILAMTSVATCFLLNAICYAIATMLMIFIKYQSSLIKKRKTKVLTDFILGWKYLARKLPLLMIYCVQMLFFVSYMTAPVLLAPFAKTVLHTSVGQFGWIEAALSLGAVIGGIASPYFAEKIGFLQVILIETILAVISFLVFSHNSYIPIAIGLYFIIGLSFSAWPLMLTFAQEQTSLAFQGRVQSLFNSVSGLLILLFYLFLGKVNQIMTVRSLYWIEVLLMLIAAVMIINYRQRMPKP